MNLWSEPGDALFGPKRPTLEKFKDLKDDAVKKGNDIASLSPDMMAKTETEKYLELFKNQRMWLSALAEKYPDPGMMAKPHGFEVGDRAYGGADTLNDRQGYFMFPGHPMYWVTERSGKSKLGVASPPASWWLQREGAQKFWEWLRPMGQSADRNGAVRGPKLQFVVGQAAMTGYGKWWPDMPSSEMDLNRHRGWYSTQWVRSTQPSNFLEIAGPAGASDGAGAGGDHGVGGASRRGSFRRRLSIAKRLPSRRTSFHAFKFFHNRDNTNRPYAPEPAKYLKPNTDWNSTGLNGNNSEKNDPEMREGDQNKFEKKFLEYRNPCLTGHVRSKASVECAKNDMQKRYLNGPDEEAFMDPKEYKDMKEEQQGIKKKGLVAKAMGGLKALAAMGIPKDPPITQSDFFSAVLDAPPSCARADYARAGRRDLQRLRRRVEQAHDWHSHRHEVREQSRENKNAPSAGQSEGRNGGDRFNGEAVHRKLQATARLLRRCDPPDRGSHHGSGDFAAGRYQVSKRPGEGFKRPSRARRPAAFGSGDD
mmetsp:Transcript_4707/g.11559  ORF Transcript_4707/g.11559 Transcript_4707/m.11559 type:complete len:535 (-) Transcript_4707:1796-3400(-)